MKPWALLSLPAALALALGPASAAEEVRITARDTVTMEFPGALAAFAVDGSTVEVSALGGQVVLHARRAGKTIVTVVMPTTTLALNILVDPAPPMVLPGFQDPLAAERGFFGIAYDTGLRRSTASLAATFGAGETRTRVRIEALHENQRDGRVGTALPFASIEMLSPGRSIVLLDKRVEASPLTVAGNVVRGVHLEQGPLELHAGIASTSPFDDLLVPRNGDRVFGAAWHAREGAIGFVPSLYLFPDSGATVPGVASLRMTYGAEADPLRVDGELAWSGHPGAAVDVDYRDAQRQAWIKAAYRPAGFAALRIARPAGSYADAAWSEQFGPATNASLSVSASRLDLEAFHPEAASARLDLRQQLDARWSVGAGVGGGVYADGRAPSLRRETASLVAAYDTPSFGASAVYRYQQTSASRLAGHGGRLAVRGSVEGWRVNAYADVQQQAPTLDLVLQDRSELGRAVTELGLGAANPEDTIRQLRDNAALLSARGISLGALRLAPLRVQGSLDVSWRGTGERAPAIGVRLLADEAQGVTGGRRNLLATLYAGWHVTRDTELIASYSQWAARGAGAGGGDRSLQLALRTSLDPLAMPGEGSRTITGQVLRDEAPAADGAVHQQPLAGIDVVLDRNRRTQTDAQGRFSFDRPGTGGHRVEVMLPQQAGAFFTAPSVLTLQPGAQATFGITFSGARLAGTVLSDAGLPLAGVTVRMEGAAPATTTTDSSGAFRFAAPAGDVTVAVVAETLPPGFELGQLVPQRSRLSQAMPAVADFSVHAQRVVEGVVSGAQGRRVTVRAQNARPVVTDTSGRFVLRGLPAGPVTLRVRNEQGETQHVVEMPAEPARVRDIRLAAP